MQGRWAEHFEELLIVSEKLNEEINVKILWVVEEREKNGNMGTKWANKHSILNIERRQYKNYKVARQYEIEIKLLKVYQDWSIP